jgi:hypothetical protein
VACVKVSYVVLRLLQRDILGGSSYFSDPQWTNHPAHFYRLHSP